MTRAGARSGARGWWNPWVVPAALLCAGLYLTWSTYIWLFASEGMLPPRWRIPDIPPSATVVSDGKGCGSGGCWREIVLDPAGDDTPRALAVEMGLATWDSYEPYGNSVEQGWRPLDPASVSISAHEQHGRLVLSVQYAGGAN